MKKFMYLFVGGKANEDKEEGKKQWMTWMQDLGQKIDSGDMFTPKSKKVKGDMQVEDYDGMEEYAMSGYLLVHAEDLDEAVEMLKGCPLLSEGGKVKVLELAEMKM